MQGCFLELCLLWCSLACNGQEIQTVLAKPEKAQTVKAVGGKSSGQCLTDELRES